MAPSSKKKKHATRTLLESPAAAPVLHRAARIEDRIHEIREGRTRKRGLHPTVIPYAGYGSVRWVRVLCRVLLTDPKSKRALAGDKVVRGWRSFTSVPLTDVDVVVEIDGTEHLVRADRGGVVDTVVEASLPSGWHTIRIRSAGSETVEAPVFIVGDDVRTGILSDIDDTVMVTALPRPFLAAWNTFVLDEHARTPTPGMAVLYERLRVRHAGAPVIYLSTGAWNVAPTLTRFLSRNLYPPGPILLTDWGPTVDRWFRSGMEHKRLNLERLAEEFPRVKWILAGDDGQHDELLYGEMTERHPDNVKVVLIRQLSAGEAVLAGGRAKAERRALDSSVPWVYAPDGASLLAQLDDLGLADDSGTRIGS
ncbi:App1 family protein [Clavibacter michiganensis]|uniref:App1 family protein n=1 Tax=Clavibacter michiganensis TaxID=28447 RepID=UPI00215730B5|nr:phosphatase domain-containing protein [Clavibacter michiganensis]